MEKIKIEFFFLIRQWDTFYFKISHMKLKNIETLKANMDLVVFQPYDYS